MRNDYEIMAGNKFSRTMASPITIVFFFFSFMMACPSHALATTKSESKVRIIC